MGGIVAFPFLNLIGLLTAAAGVWLLVVLMRADVRAAFERNPAGVAYTPTRSRATRTAWLILFGLFVLVIALASLAIPFLRRAGQPRKVETKVSTAVVPMVGQPAEYVALVHARVARHPTDELDTRLGSARDTLALEQARFQAGLSEAIRVDEAQTEVDFITAEKAGATDRELIAIRLKLARHKLALLEARRQAGVVDGREVDAARAETAVLESLLGDEVVAPFESLAAQRSRQHRLVEARYDAGLATHAEMNAAKRELALANDRLERVQAHTMNEAALRAGAVVGPEGKRD